MNTATIPKAWVKSRRLNWDYLMASVKENFARNLSALLKNHDRKAIELARALKVNPSTITGWTSARIAPELSRLDEIAEFFGVTYQDLLRGDGTVPAPPKPQDLDSILRDFAKVRGFELVPRKPK